MCVKDEKLRYRIANGEDDSPVIKQHTREPVIYPDDQVPIVTVEEDYEYDCGSPCTVDGCLGHATDVPTHISIDNVWFVVEGFESGDYPSENAQVKEVKSVIRRLQLVLEKAREVV